MKLNSGLVQELSTLSSEELKAVRNIVDTILGSENKEDIASSVLLTALDKFLGGFTASKLTGDLAKKWNRNSKDASSFIQKVFKPRTKLAELAISSLLITILVDDLKERGIPPTVKTLVEHLPRLQEVFENQFPGYIQSGLTSLIMKRLTGGKK